MNYGNLFAEESTVDNTSEIILATKWYSDKCTLFWKKNNIRKHTIYRLNATRLAKLRLPKDTPCTQGSEKWFDKGGEKALSTALQMIREGHKGENLILLPTPNQRDHKGVSGVSRRSPKISDFIEGRKGTKTGLRYQPAFALWMMGFPLDWCDFPLELKS